MDFPRDLLAVRSELVDYIRTAIADHGAPLDTGGGLGRADIWFTCDGVEYLLSVQKSALQLRREKEAASD